MSRGLKGLLWCLPVFIILAHDAYVGVSAPGGFHLSELGWWLENYLPDAHDWFIHTMGEEYYGNFLKPFFQQKALFIFGAIAAVGCLWQVCFSQFEQSDRLSRHR